MAISSFYGLQTSLRGLLAQQRSLDTTATTSRTPRPRATRARRRSWRPRRRLTSRPAAARRRRRAARRGRRRAGLTGACATTFLDLQYRGQDTNAGRAEGALGVARSRRALARRAQRRRHQQAQLSEFWYVVVGPRQRSRRACGAAGRAVAGAAALTDAIQAVRAARDGRRRAGQTTTGRTRPMRHGHAGRRDRQERRRLARPRQDDQGVRHRRRHAERPAGPARPAARQARRATARCPSSSIGDAARSTCPSGRDRRAGVPDRRRDRDRRRGAARRPSTDAPGGEIGGLLGPGHGGRDGRQATSAQLDSHHGEPADVGRRRATAATSSTTGSRPTDDRRGAPGPTAPARRHRGRPALGRPTTSRSPSPQLRGNGGVDKRLQGVRRQGR